MPWHKAVTASAACSGRSVDVRRRCCLPLLDCHHPALRSTQKFLAYLQRGSWLPRGELLSRFIEKRASPGCLRPQRQFWTLHCAWETFHCVRETPSGLKVFMD
jgi:hypothetical protein